MACCPRRRRGAGAALRPRFLLCELLLVVSLLVFALPRALFLAPVRALFLLVPSWVLFLLAVPLCALLLPLLCALLCELPWAR
jgi:hypothetical protein